MPYFQYLIDARHLSQQERETILDFIFATSSVHDIYDAAGVYQVFYEPMELDYLNDPILSKCKIHKL